jgi:hypothetical protein
LLAATAWAVAVPDGDDWRLETPAPTVPVTPAVLTRLDEISCTECHAEIVDEWASTTHALAWVDEFYQEGLEGRRRPRTCHGCHIPESIHADLGGRPDPREEGKHFGVSCESCHVATDGVTMLGPRGIETDAHPVQRSDSMTGAGSNQLCSGCHSTNIGPVIGIAKDFKNSGQAEKGRTCVGCHMAPFERDDGTIGRRHTLQTPRDPSFLRQAFAVSAAVAGDKTVVTLGNRTGHRIPGVLGRELLFAAQVLDPSGAVVGEAELKLSNRSFLPVDDATRLEVQAVGSSVRLTGLHTDPRVDDPVPFLDETLSVQ